ncbi:MAG: phage integrase SAM-like domain-containing protein [Crocinitomicaceae bacterium]|nr:phage integrase SAM-like domain-containing protein [Crocinitomicaceae bacterium]
MGKLKTSFVLKKYKGNEKQVMLYLSFGYKEYDSFRDKYSYKPLRYYTGVRVTDNEWDNDQKLPANSKKLKELLSMDHTAHDIFSYLQRGNGEITPDVLRKELDEKLKGKANVKNIIGIVDYIENEMLISGTNRSKSTLIGYKDLAKRLKSFEKKRRITLNVESFNEVMFLDFMNEMRKQHTRLNSVSSIYRKLRAVLNEISRRYKVTVFNPSKDLAKIDKPRSIKEEKVYLSFEHIQKILSHEPKEDGMKNVKLIFTTLLFTGCRYSDVFKIKPEYTYEKGGIKFRYARYIDLKTNTDIIAPILFPLEYGYELNDGEVPRYLAMTSFNLAVKDLAKDAGLKEKVKISYTNPYGEKKFEEKRLYKFISSHTGRRSFITNLINHVPVTVLSKITGHSLTNQNVIFGYNKISLTDNAVLFVKELKRIRESNPEDFPIRLI